jgi:hypothetical protein
MHTRCQRRATWLSCASTRFLSGERFLAPRGPAAGAQRRGDANACGQAPTVHLSVGPLRQTCVTLTQPEGAVPACLWWGPAVGSSVSEAHKNGRGTGQTGWAVQSGQFHVFCAAFAQLRFAQLDLRDSFCLFTSVLVRVYIGQQRIPPSAFHVFFLHTLPLPPPPTLFSFDDFALCSHHTSALSQPRLRAVPAPGQHLCCD